MGWVIYLRLNRTSLVGEYSVRRLHETTTGSDAAARTAERHLWRLMLPLTIIVPTPTKPNVASADDTSNHLCGHVFVTAGTISCQRTC